MKTLLCFLFSSMLALPLISQADNETYGKLESRPVGKAGSWVIGGKTYEATDKTKLEEDEGPLEIGSCVEVESDDGKAEEIESKKMDKCS